MDLVADQYAAADGYPRPRGPALSLDTLKPADILLSRGTTDISRAIVAADGGSYSHAALWTGSTIIEATLDGITEHSFRGDRDVFRRRGLHADTAVSAIEIARAQLGKQYAYSELLLLGTLFKLGIRPRRPLLSIVLSVLGPGAERLQAWLEQCVGDRAPRICTELVAVSFFRARPGPSALQVIPREARPRPENDCSLESLRSGFELSGQPGADFGHWEAGPEWEELRARCVELLSATSAAALEELPAIEPTDTSRKILWGAVAVSSDNAARLGVISPADIQFSPSLEYVGRMMVPEGGAIAGADDVS
jgi:hypothetical protein